MFVTPAQARVQVRHHKPHSNHKPQIPTRIQPKIRENIGDATCANAEPTCQACRIRIHTGRWDQQLLIAGVVVKSFKSCVSSGLLGSLSCAL